MSEFVYQNPIGADVIKNIRDPFILLEGDTYFLTGTIPPYWDGKSEGVKLWKSKDLLNWEEVGFILHRSVAKENDWFRDYWWAPEIHKKNDQFYLTVNCRNDDVKGGGHNALVCVSGKIDGEYEIINRKEPFFSVEKFKNGFHIGDHGNDANLFTDDDGKTYISTCCYQGISLYEIDLDTATLIGDPVMVVEPSVDGWDTKNEGSFIMKRNGIYYCFWSSFTRSYEVGVAYAENIRGPWIKDKNNPIIRPEKTQGIVHSGHNCIFTDKDGRTMTAFHITLEGKEDTQLLAIDPIYFDEEGRVYTPAPTLDIQVLK